MLVWLEMGLLALGADSLHRWQPIWLPDGLPHVDPAISTPCVKLQEALHLVAAAAASQRRCQAKLAAPGFPPSMPWIERSRLPPAACRVLTKPLHPGRAVAQLGSSPWLWLKQRCSVPTRDPAHFQWAHVLGGLLEETPRYQLLPPLVVGGRRLVAGLSSLPWPHRWCASHSCPQLDPRAPSSAQTALALIATLQHPVASCLCQRRCLAECRPLGWSALVADFCCAAPDRGKPQ
mmetsp:Transcript_35326/g.82503  ORF Transcript_35326/g.82503 Transcript_35326/m.82503 type:complete len:234 (-) Transcript_35326:1328-2029(-)